MTRALTGWAAAMVPVEPLDRAAASLHWARRALGLAAAAISGPPVAAVGSGPL